MSKLWFKRKQYGWGWVPSSFEGWATLFVYGVVLVAIVKHAEMNSVTDSDVVLYTAIPAVIASALLIAVCYYKGETPRWQWDGKGKKDEA
jgi:hypothetical protein